MTFEIYQDDQSEWRWRLRASNGEIVAIGEAYKKKGACLKCIALVMDCDNAQIKEIPLGPPMPSKPKDSK